MDLVKYFYRILLCICTLCITSCEDYYEETRTEKEAILPVENKAKISEIDEKKYEIIEPHLKFEEQDEEDEIKFIDVLIQEEGNTEEEMNEDYLDEDTIER